MFHLDGVLPGRYILLAGSPLSPTGNPPRSFAMLVTVPTLEPLARDFSLETMSRYSLQGTISLAEWRPPSGIHDPQLVTARYLAEDGALSLILISRADETLFPEKRSAIPL